MLSLVFGDRTVLVDSLHSQRPSTLCAQEIIWSAICGLSLPKPLADCLTVFNAELLLEHGRAVVNDQTGIGCRKVRLDLICLAQPWGRVVETASYYCWHRIPSFGSSILILLVHISSIMALSSRMTVDKDL
jgi:hypothetical protein